MKEATGRAGYLAVVVAALGALVVGSLWYSPLLFGDATLRLRSLDPGAVAATVPPAKMLAEAARCLVVAAVLARLIGLLGVVEWKGAVRLAAWLWVGFPATLLAGSVLWEDVPWELAAIHAGDWLVKVILVAVVLGVWRQRRAS